MPSPLSPWRPARALARLKFAGAEDYITYRSSIPTLTRIALEGPPVASAGGPPVKLDGGAWATSISPKTILTHSSSTHGEDYSASSTRPQRASCRLPYHGPAGKVNKYGTRFSTLDPERLTPDRDWIDLSYRPNILDAALHPFPSRFVPPDHLPRCFGVHGFLPGTHGYFYRVPSSSGLSVAAQIRFRLMPSESPTAFELGSDLIGVDNLPWRLFVLPLLRAEVAVPVVRILQKDGFLPQRDVERFTLFTDPPTRRPILRDTVISFNHIEEPFGVSFGGVKYGGNVWVVGETFVHCIPLTRLLHKRPCSAPHSGTMVFTLERLVSKTGPNYALRCRKIVEPLSYPFGEHGPQMNIVEGKLVTLDGRVLSWEIGRRFGAGQSDDK